MKLDTKFKERPILFSTPMVQAILRGTKIQTRRIIKPQPSFPHIQEIELLDVLLYENMLANCPYGKPGDRLWVRETFSQDKITGDWCYAANQSHGKLSLMHSWKPSIHMPRKACRLILEISDIKVQRLQDISEEEAIAEGIEVIEFDDETMYRNYSEFDICLRSPIASFCSLWESINGVDPWSANPWVWAINFKTMGGDGTAGTFCN